MLERGLAASQSHFCLGTSCSSEAFSRFLRKLKTLYKSSLRVPILLSC
ncbi:putative lipoprotein [Leptospira santarosai str. ST188]|nr:putative lipoprotein [Leptospira santarosai str. ST188]